MEQQQTAEVSQEVAPQQPAATEQSSFSIPQEYNDRGWAKEGKIKSPDDLFKAYDNAQSLIGKKAAAPAMDAPQEEWDSYYSALRPETPDGYDFGELEGLPEGYDADGLKQTAAKLSHEIGLTPKQAKDLVQKYVASEMESAKAINARLDQEFQELSKAHFGDDLEGAKNITRDMVSNYVPEDLRESVLSLQDNPKAMLAVAKMAAGAKAEIEKIKSEYGAEGKITSGGQTSSQGIESVRTELAKLRTDKSSQDPFHPEYSKNQERIKMLSDQVSRFYNKR